MLLSQLSFHNQEKKYNIEIIFRTPQFTKKKGTVFEYKFYTPVTDNFIVKNSRKKGTKLESTTVSSLFLDPRNDRSIPSSFQF